MRRYLVLLWVATLPYCVPPQKDPFGVPPHVGNMIDLDIANNTGYYIRPLIEHSTYTDSLPAILPFTHVVFVNIPWPEGEFVRIVFNSKKKVCVSKYKPLEPGLVYHVTLKRDCFVPKN